MKIEHIALNVSDPVGMSAWYKKHFNLKIVRHIPEPYQTHFLADEKSTIIEIYSNPTSTIPKYNSMDPLQLHLAFETENPAYDVSRLIADGATIASETHLPDGTHLAMLRDPWGLSLQLCKRAQPLLSSSP